MTLKTLMGARSVSQSELARRVGLSRQAVSLWLKQPGAVRVKGHHLVAVAKALESSVERLVSPLPLRDERLRRRLQARLLWDRSYPSLEDFAVAVTRRDPRALGRLVEVYGLYAAAKIAGANAIWRGFPRYRRFISPIRRRELEPLWQWKASLRPA